VPRIREPVRRTNPYNAILRATTPWTDCGYCRVRLRKMGAPPTGLTRGNSAVNARTTVLTRPGTYSFIVPTWQHLFSDAEAVSRIRKITIASQATIWCPANSLQESEPASRAVESVRLTAPAMLGTPANRRPHLAASTLPGTGVHVPPRLRWEPDRRPFRSRVPRSVRGQPFGLFGVSVHTVLPLLRNVALRRDPPAMPTPRTTAPEGLASRFVR
jgi:hypothetical protein